MISNRHDYGTIAQGKNEFKTLCNLNQCKVWELLRLMLNRRVLMLDLLEAECKKVPALPKQYDAGTYMEDDWGL